jgi:uncharacterized cupin superfamily protein
MSRMLIETSLTSVELRPSPIEPSWVVEGDPVAESAVLSKSSDRTATTIVWQCSAGTFDWHYAFDETIYLLEGSVVLTSDSMPPTRFGPGDVVFFRNGARARWHVEERVRKLAFCRETQPAFVGLALKVLAKLRRLATPAAGSGKAGALALSPR